MGWGVKAAAVRLFFFLLRLADAVMSRMFGYTIWRVSLDNVLSGLTPEEQAEALHPQVAAPLGHMIDGLQKDRTLTAPDRLMAVEELRHILRTRAGVTKELAQKTDIRETRVERPMFIIGLPRTGTTMLHLLLSQDPRWMAPMFWELARPFPAGRPHNWRKCERYRIMDGLLEMRDAVTIDHAAIHVIHIEQPEECVLCTQRSFLNFQWFSRLPSLTALKDWFYSLKHRQYVDIYRSYREQLQMVGYQGMDDKFYLLKSNVHLLCLDALLEVFPDACLVFTFRPLTEVIPSFASMMEKVFSNLGKPDAEYGKRVLELLAAMANRGAATMKAYDDKPEGEQPFHLLNYYDLVADPMEAVRGIYARFDLELTPDVEERMGVWMRANPQHKHGKHRYSMKDYGLTERDVKDACGGYLEYMKGKADRLI